MFWIAFAYQGSEWGLSLRDFYIVFVTITPGRIHTPHIRCWVPCDSQIYFLTVLKICAGCTLINIGILVPSSLINLTEWLGGFWISFFAIKDLLCERCEMKKYKWHFWNIAWSFFIYNFQSRVVKIRTWEYYTTLRGNFYYVPETCWLFSFQVSYYCVISI